MIVSFFFFNDTATTEIYTLSLHDALPICERGVHVLWRVLGRADGEGDVLTRMRDGDIAIAHPGKDVTFTVCADRKSTRLNSSHVRISYAVFCLKKKKQQNLLKLGILGSTS